MRADSSRDSVDEFIEEHAKRTHSDEFEQYEEVDLRRRIGRKGAKVYNIETKNSVDESTSEYTWNPDHAFSIFFVRDRSTMSKGEKEPGYWRVKSDPISYPAEIKTGEYAELSDRQKGAMRAVSKHRRTHPILIQVSLEGMPEEYSVRVRTVTDRD